MHIHIFNGGQESQRPRRVPWKLHSSRQMTSTANLPHPSPEHASFSGRATSVVIRRELVFLQLNAEGISKAKIQVIEHLATKNLATVILLQKSSHESRCAEHIRLQPSCVHEQQSSRSGDFRAMSD